VIETIDKFCWEYFMVHVGDAKGLILDKAILHYQPNVVLELGSYCGYSAVRIARLLPPGGKLISVEINPLHAAIATKVVEWAGLADKVRIVIGSAETVLSDKPNIRFAIESIDLVFIDHSVSSYLSDLKIIEKTGLLKDGSVIVADNVLFPGAPDYLRYIKASTHYQSSTHESTLEYTTAIKDGVEISIYKGS